MPRFVRKLWEPIQLEYSHNPYSFLCPGRTKVCGTSEHGDLSHTARQPEEVPRSPQVQTPGPPSEEDTSHASRSHEERSREENTATNQEGNSLLCEKVRCERVNWSLFLRINTVLML